MDDAFTKALSLLPHGPEFRFVDKLLSLTPGVEGVGEYRVRGDELFLRGHFPGEPIFPGVLLTEGAAQLAGVVAQSDSRVPPLADLRLTALRNVKILGAARPGDVIQMRVTITGRLGGLVQAEAQSHVGDRLILEAGLTLGGREKQSVS
jgi:3-hydroxyacyl-[acyl-carrier-protein] dehydratase